MTLSQRLLIAFACLTMISFVLAGCTSGDHKENHANEKKKHDHEHPTKGPHGGAIVEWGEEEYHPEVKRDKEKKTVTVYIFDEEIEEYSPIDAKEITITITNLAKPLQVPLKADRQKDDPEGKSSRFTAPHEEFGSDKKLKGVVQGKIGAKPYRGGFDEATIK